MSIADFPIRERAFAWLQEQVALHGEVLSRKLLTEGFVYNDDRVRFLGPQGIFKPKCMELPLSIATVPSGPYDDAFGSDGLLQYRYRGNDPGHRDNIGLRKTMEGKVPLAYFQRIVKGKYLAAWPVYIRFDNPSELTFSVAVDDAQVIGPRLADRVADGISDEREVDILRGYATRVFRQRLHRQQFRERVLQAYRGQCTLCGLRHQELLDAAHIVPDSEPGGDPVVPNGLSLCKLHHAAFDRQFIGIRDDYVVQVRPDILEEEDGPMLLHGLKKLHGSTIQLPSSPLIYAGLSQQQPMG
jgi:putative restriction endonuclease